MIEKRMNRVEIMRYVHRKSIDEIVKERKEKSSDRVNIRIKISLLIKDYLKSQEISMNEFCERHYQDLGYNKSNSAYNILGNLIKGRSFGSSVNGEHQFTGRELDVIATLFDIMDVDDHDLFNKINYHKRFDYPRKKGKKY